MIELRRAGRLAVLALGVVGLLAHPSVANEDPPCEPGRYLVKAKPLTKGSDAVVLDVGTGEVEIEGLCDAKRPKKFKTDSKGRTKVLATKLSCDGLRGKPKFQAKIVDGCTRLVGKLKAKNYKRKFEAELVACSELVLPGEFEVGIAPGSSAPGCEETDSCFEPSLVHVAEGGRVTWPNDDSAAHTISSGTPAEGLDGVFDSGLLSAGQTFEHTFSTVGEHPYFCLVHPWSTGSVFVGPCPLGETCVVPNDSCDLGIPAFVRDTLCLWADGAASDLEFFNTIDFLITNGTIPGVDPTADIVVAEIPKWIRAHGRLYCDGQLSDADLGVTVRALIAPSG